MSLTTDFRHTVVEHAQRNATAGFEGSTRGHHGTSNLTIILNVPRRNLQTNIGVRAS